MTYLDSTVEVVICIGSNCGDRYQNVDKGINWINSILSTLRTSTIYATPDCKGGPRKYMNAVAIGKTDITLQQLEIMCKNFEKELGRDEKARETGDVPIDIDIVVYNGKILRETDYIREFFKIGFYQLR